MELKRGEPLRNKNLNGGKDRKGEKFMAKKQFSEAEKQAYYAGQAYALAKKGKRVKCKTEEGKASFKAGVEKVRGGGKKSSPKTETPKFSAAEKRAYNIGVGVAAATDDKKVEFRTPEERDSFVKGLIGKRN